MRIELIDNVEALKQHMNIMAVSFEFPEPIANYILDLHLSHEFLEDTDVRYYLGRVDGKPVAIAVLFLSGGVAGIYNIVTVPQMRHQGIGRAMTLAPLHDADRLGYHVAVIQATGMGINLYRQLGFEDHFAFDSYSSRRAVGQ